MTIPSPAAAPRERVSFRWLTNARHDVTWYIGSAIVGWLYAGLILLAVSRLADPLHDALGVIRLGGLHIPLTLQLLVYGSWAFLLDAPHLFSTLARTFLDPEERRVRRRELWVSWLFFLLGPTLVLLPYGLQMLAPALPVAILPLGAVLFTVFFRLWAYYHVVRQHWGFVALYRRKHGETDRAGQRLDEWVFYLLLWSPLVMFLSGSFYALTPGMPALGLESLRVGPLGVAPALHLIAWAAFLGALLVYLWQQVRLWRQGTPLNGPKLLLLAAIVPLHLATFSNPWLAAMLTPIVTVGHNLQYHRIVWNYGQSTYKSGAAGWIFSRVWVYFGLGLLFTFALYRGPWIDWLQATLGIALNESVLAGVGMMAGLADPAAMTLGQQLFGACLLGWAMQHYYLDAKIWRVGKDRAVAQRLGV
jgi:hypothetical protein